MLNRVLEIQEENRYLSLKRGFIVINQGSVELGSVPLDDIAVLLLSAQGVTLTKNVLNALAEKGCVTVLCGKNYVPESMVIPYLNHYQSTKIIKFQIDASLPLNKSIWKQIVIQKIKNQALNLRFCGKEKDSQQIEDITNLVKSGDKDNREAYAARLYWPLLFGKGFIRDKDGDGFNGLLNYGYAIMRAAMVRAISARGLLPTLGIHHQNMLNQFCLADDLFEIYRPMVDRMVYWLIEQGIKEVSVESKKHLAKVLKIKVHTSEGWSTASQSMIYLVDSYVKSLEDGKSVINLPEWKDNENGITVIE